MKHRAAIIFFVKSPVAGKVKTRLGREITQTNAVFLYKNFVKDIFSTLGKCDCEIRIYFSPENGRSRIMKLLGEPIAVYPQQGDDLGKKMENALHETFETGFEKAVLIGSDIPDISKDIIISAVDALSAYPAVIGPATDGGYYLIGFTEKAFMPGLFSGIVWSGPEVLSRTTDLFKKNKIDFFMLQALMDIDTLNDLKHFMKKEEQHLKITPYTFNALKKSGLFPARKINGEKEFE
ncbi:MAG: glycosyltransferase [Deltaproteobacteria bacterium]|nr:glycosyltransferase [Deltaproteobacteria bacterium]